MPPNYNTRGALYGINEGLKTSLWPAVQLMSNKTNQDLANQLQLMNMNSQRTANRAKYMELGDKALAEGRDSQAKIYWNLAKTEGSPISLQNFPSGPGVLEKTKNFIGGIFNRGTGSLKNSPQPNTNSQPSNPYQPQYMPGSGTVPGTNLPQGDHTYKFNELVNQGMPPDQAAEVSTAPDQYNADLRYNASPSAGQYSPNAPAGYSTSSDYGEQIYNQRLKEQADRAKQLVSSRQPIIDTLAPAKQERATELAKLPGLDNKSFEGAINRLKDLGFKEDEITSTLSNSREIKLLGEMYNRILSNPHSVGFVAGGDLAISEHIPGQSLTMTQRDRLDLDGLMGDLETLVRKANKGQGAMTEEDFKSIMKKYPSLNWNQGAIIQRLDQLIARRTKESTDQFNALREKKGVFNKELEVPGLFDSGMNPNTPEKPLGFGSTTPGIFTKGAAAAGGTVAGSTAGGAVAAGLAKMAGRKVLGRLLAGGLGSVIGGPIGLVASYFLADKILEGGQAGYDALTGKTEGSVPPLNNQGNMTGGAGITNIVSQDLTPMQSQEGDTVLLNDGDTDIVIPRRMTQGPPDLSTSSTAADRIRIPSYNGQENTAKAINALAQNYSQEGFELLKKSFINSPDLINTQVLQALSPEALQIIEDVFAAIEQELPADEGMEYAGR